MKKYELLIKSREAMMSAVQVYNNPHITFKSETFITLSVIAWTYLLHTYYANKKIDYRYYEFKGKRKRYHRTKYGAYKHWELERCLDEEECPLDSNTKKNLKFLIGIRHEIEHQMTQRIDRSISAKLLACSINYNYYIKKLFGNVFGVDQELGMAIQFSPIEAEQKSILFNNEKMSTNIKKFITDFEDTLSPDEIGNTHYAYRVVFVRVDGKRVNSETDQVISFLPTNSPEASQINATYTLIKETEKKKYLSKEIVELMHQKGFTWLSVPEMTNFWKNELRTREEYGLYITKSQWMWYQNWIPVIEKYCNEKQKKICSKIEKGYLPSEIVNIMQQRGYSRFSRWWFVNFWRNDLKIDRNNTEYGFYGKYNRFYWRKTFIPLVEKYCQENSSEFK
ncbi:MAG: DUF3644 domain-containing protein [Lachnospiraceae bacterium]|nr:DUF3644 domain-containing protein [Lachnospiraceae bacterium]